jgi:hypothetical protein
VQANVEIQSAARKVARENIMLRELLEVRGVERKEVEEYVRRGGVSGEGRPAGAAVTGENVLLEGMGRAENEEFPRPRGSRSGQVLHGSFRNSDLMAEHNDSAGQAPPATIASGSISAKFSEPPTEPATLTSRNSLCRPSPMETGQQHQSLDDVTSCEIAANIIAGMRGHGDEEEARAELGCSPDSSCVVGNMTVFELLDR